MKSKTLRIVIPIALVATVGAGFATQGGIGTLAALGWQDVSLLCPLGALSAMLASKLLIPRALISVAIACIVVLLVGRAFCAWACPVPVVAKLRDAFSKKKTPADAKHGARGDDRGQHPDEAGGEVVLTPLSEGELAALDGCARSQEGHRKGCSSCAEKRGSIDSRHFVLGGALASAAIFGFPVFCLVCPIGLTFATVLLAMRLFGGGDMTWAVVAVPALLLVEVVLFRKWCASFCPLSALMSLVAKANKTLRPVVDESACLETSRGATCGRCAISCPEGIDIRHLELGASLSECTRCRACVDACPAQAVSIPFRARKLRKEGASAVVLSADDALGDARPADEGRS